MITLIGISVTEVIFYVAVFTAKKLQIQNFELSTKIHSTFRRASEQGPCRPQVENPSTAVEMPRQAKRCSAYASILPDSPHKLQLEQMTRTRCTASVPLVLTAFTPPSILLRTVTIASHYTRTLNRNAFRESDRLVQLVNAKSKLVLQNNKTHEYLSDSVREELQTCTTVA